MWEEALIVTILVAFTIHLEGDALIKAREAMQGGLDRLPRTARKVDKTARASPNSVDHVVVFHRTCGLTSGLAAGPGLNAMMQSEPRMDIVPHSCPGDKIEIRSGELIPADGRIIEGKGALNKAPLTGESVPVDVRVGDTIEAGLVLAQGPVVCEKSWPWATRPDCRASSTPSTPSVRSLLDCTAALRNSPPSGFRWSCSGRLPFGISHSRRIGKSSSSCGWFPAPVPCCWPHRCRTQRRSPTQPSDGAVVRGGDALERMAHVNHILLDKTGTLTSGKPKFGGIVMGKGRRKQSALQVMMGLESKSNHLRRQHCGPLYENEGIKAANIKELNDIDSGRFRRARNHRGGLHSSR